MHVEVPGRPDEPCPRVVVALGPVAHSAPPQPAVDVGPATRPEDTVGDRVDVEGAP